MEHRAAASASGVFHAYFHASINNTASAFHMRAHALGVAAAASREAS